MNIPAMDIPEFEFEKSANDEVANTRKLGFILGGISAVFIVVGIIMCTVAEHIRPK